MASVKAGTESNAPTSLSLAMADLAYEMIESSGGVLIALHDLGGPKSKTAVPVLLFSHATGLHGRVFEPMASFLNDRFRCVSLDLRGHGMSELPPGASLAWSGMADDVAGRSEQPTVSRLDQLHGIGHSMGGAALLLAAARRPDAFRSLWLYEPVIVPPESWTVARWRQSNVRRLLPGGATGSTRWTRPMRTIDRSPRSDQLHPDALRAYVDGGFSSSADGTVVLRCRPSTEAEVFRHAADERRVGQQCGVRDAGGRRCRTS